jgi:hypothetical protein
MASICRWVYPEGHKSAGTVAFKRGLGKKECMEIGGKDAQWFEDEWKPNWPTGYGPEDMQYPMNANKDATLELRDRNNYVNSIWAQQGEEALIRDRANFGFSPDSTGFYPGAGANGGDLQGRMTVPPQPQGHDFSPGTIWHQDMLNTAADNRAADLKKYPNYTGFQDNDPSMLDTFSENPESWYGPKNRLGDYEPEIPINQPTDVNGQPISLDFQGGGDAQALAEAERYDQIMTQIPAFGEDWQSNPALAEQAKFYQDSVAGAQPKSYSTSGYGGRSGDQYAEKPGERVAYMNEQARLAAEEQLLRDEKDSNIGLANYTPPVHPDVVQANQNIFQGAVEQRALEAEKGPDIGLANYTPPVNEEQRKRDENLFNLARMEMEKSPDIGLANYTPPVNKEQREADQKQYNAAKIARGIPLDDADVSMENLEKAEADGVEVIDGEHWWTTPDPELNKIIEESGLANWLDSAEENTPDWAKDYIKGMKQNWENKEYATLAGKVFVTRLGVKWGLKTAWKMLPFTSKGLTKNMVKVVIAGETHQIYTELDSDVPILEQIQAKVDEIMNKGAAGGPEVVEVDGDGTVIVDDKKDDKTTTKVSALDALSNDATAFSQFNGMGGATTNASSTPNAFNGGVTQQQGYTGNIMDMFTNLWNPNPAQSDYWYKTREGDVPGNNRMREAMARLAYMGLYPEDRGTDPYQALSDDRIAYNNNQLDAASSQATLNATASNRQYTQWKNMLPTQGELAKQLVETAGWAPWGMSQDELDKKADRDAGALLRKFHGLMAKGVAPTPDNLRVSNALEKAGLPVNAQTVQYALENGLLDEDTGNDDDGGGESKTSSILSNTKGFLSSVQNAFL